jgi:ABC-type branched-subunit amino acid transport system permease subunit
LHFHHRRARVEYSYRLHRADFLGAGRLYDRGGYISALLVGQAGWNFFFALPVAGLGAGMIGLLFGLPSLRVKGFYLVMATLSAQFIIPWFTRNAYQEHVERGAGTQCAGADHQPAGHCRAMFSGNHLQRGNGACVYRFATPGQFIYITLVVLIFTTIVAHNISRSRLGGRWSPFATMIWPRSCWASTCSATSYAPFSWLLFTPDWPGAAGP